MNDRGTPRILLVDDHPAVRAGLALVLEEEGVGKCCEALPGEEPLDVIGRELPDMALLGMDSGNDRTAALLGELRARRIPVLVCSIHESAICANRTVAAATGFITRGEARDVARAVRGILQGRILTGPRVAEGRHRSGSLDDALALLTA